MATTVKEKITVAELSKFGFKVGNEYVNYSKQFSEADKAKVVPGAVLEAELYVADSGKKYLNKVLSAVAVEVVTPKAVDTERAKKFTPTFNKDKAPDNTMSKDEWRLKDERISRQGIIQVAVQVMSDFDEAVKLADRMLDYVNKNTPK